MLFPRRLSLFDRDFVDDMFNDPFFSNDKNMSLMSTDVKENENSYILDVEVPGFEKENIKMSMENGYLTIEANKNETNDKKDEEGTIISRERYQGRAVRSFYVGDNLTQEDIKANLTNGVLQVTVAKKDVKEIESKKYISIE